MFVVAGKCTEGRSEQKYGVAKSMDKLVRVEVDGKCKVNQTSRRVPSTQAYVKRGGKEVPVPRGWRGYTRDHQTGLYTLNLY